MTLPAVGEAAPDVVLRDSDGDDVRLSSFWRDRPVVAVFLRHWG